MWASIHVFRGKRNTLWNVPHLNWQSNIPNISLLPGSNHQARLCILNRDGGGGGGESFHVCAWNHTITPQHCARWMLSRSGAMTFSCHYRVSFDQILAPCDILLSYLAQNLWWPISNVISKNKVPALSTTTIRIRIPNHTSCWGQIVGLVRLVAYRPRCSDGATVTLKVVLNPTESINL